MGHSEDSREHALSLNEDQGVPHVTRRQALQGALVAGTAVAVGGVQSAAAHTTRRHGGHLIVGAGIGNGDTWDPQGPQLGDGSDIRRDMVFQKLAHFKPGTLGIVPQLAESWEPNRTGTQWTIHVRRGVEFHNGKTLTAHDVLYSLHRAAIKGVNKASWVLVDFASSKVVGKYTVRLHFKGPYGPIEDLLGT